jgi:hypothetical protein
MALVIDRLYFGRRPSSREMATNASILSLYQRQGRTWAELARVVEGLALRRDRGEIKSIGQREPVSLRWLHSQKQLLNQLAVSEDAYYKAPPQPETKKAKPTGVEGMADILSRFTKGAA